MDDGDSPIPSLVDAAVSGNEIAWYELVDRYTPLLATVLRGAGLAAVEAQDVAQTVWLRMVEHLDSLREPRALPMWLITTAKREALRCISDRQRSIPCDPVDLSWLPSPDSGAEPDADLLRAERHEVLLAGLAELPARQRELLLLLAADPPLSYAQITERTGFRTGSIGPTRGRALERLRETFAVRDYLASLEAGGEGQPARTVPSPATRTDRERGDGE